MTTTWSAGVPELSFLCMHHMKVWWPSVQGLLAQLIDGQCFKQTPL